MGGVGASTVSANWQVHDPNQDTVVSEDWYLRENPLYHHGPTVPELEDSGLKVVPYTINEITSVTFPNGEPISKTATYTVAANSFIATGGDGFTVFKEGANPQTLGSDLDALEAHIGSLPQPFSAPNPATEQRITKQG